MKETKYQIMAGVDDHINAHIIANNTIEYTRANGDKVIRLHQTDIMTITPRGKISLNTGGWQTVTTKERLNRYLPSGFRINQEKGIWYLNEIPYRDGMTIGVRGKISGGGSVSKSLRLIKQINQYCTKVRQLKTIPLPNGGDCFICRMPEPDCIQSHLDEGYIHGTILVNALQWAGYGDTGVRFYMTDMAHQRTSLISALRRYLKSRLGLAR